LNPVLLIAGILENGTMNILEEIETVSTKDWEIAAPVAIKIHPSGNSLLVSNCFVDTISLFTLDRSSNSVSVLMDGGY
jgi:6-phosphogluconolactonase